MNPFASLLCCSEIQDTWRSNGFFFLVMDFFCLQLPTRLAFGWVKAADCHLAHFATQPSPHCSINSIPCFHQTGLLTLSQGVVDRTLLRWVHLLGCSLFFLLLNYANLHKSPQGTFLAFLSHHHQLLPPPLPQQQK